MEIKHRGLGYRLKKGWPAYLFIMPATLLIGLVKVKPMLEGIILSFYKAGLKSKFFVGLENFKNLTGTFLTQELINTLIFAAILVPSMLIISLILAGMISKFGKTKATIFRGAFYLPKVTAGVVMTMVWLWMFNPIWGIFNYILSFMGIKPVMWLADPVMSKLSVCMVVIVSNVASSIIIFSAAIAGVSKRYLEAASLEGANSLQIFRYVTVPLISPTVLFLLLTTTSGSFQIFSAVILLTEGGPMHSTLTVGLNIYHQGFLYYRFGIAAAHGVVLLAIIFIICFFQFRIMRRRFEY